MQGKLKSVGQCLYCQETFSKEDITQHLNGHVAEMQNRQQVSVRAFHLSVVTSAPFFQGAELMFLNILIDGSATLLFLDRYLREIWVDCCGHQSSFRVKGKTYTDDWDNPKADIGESKRLSLSRVLEEGMELDYEYDFGSTTYLTIKVEKALEIIVPAGIQLLSRNEPLAIMCGMCGLKPAKKVCTVHIHETPEAFLCNTCGSKHGKICPDYKDYAAMKVVNSPRMGTCAYEGGSIDKKRGGIFKG